MSAAMLSALQQYAAYSTGYDFMWATLPLDGNWSEIASYLDTQGAASGIGKRFEDYMKQLLPLVQAIASNSGSGSGSPVVSFAGTTNISEQLGFATGSTLRDTLADMARDLSQVNTNLQDNLDFSYYTDFYGKNLLVRDNALEEVVSALANNFSQFAGSFGMYAQKMDYYWLNSESSSSALASGLSDISGKLTDIRQAQQGQIDYLDEDVSSDESDYRTDALGEYDEEEEAATDYFEDISLPSVDDSYSPSISDPSIDESDLGIQNDDAVYHNALLRLVTARDASNIVPEIEVDFGRMSSLVNGLSQFASWIEWLAGSLFALLLSAKGLAMWRVVRTASVSAQCGEAPIVHLAYNPF